MSLGSRVSPNIFGLMFMGSVVVYLYCKLCAVFRWIWCEESACCFVWIENDIGCVCPCRFPCRYDLMFAFAMFMLLCIDLMVLLSAISWVILVLVVLECQMYIC